MSRDMVLTHDKNKITLISKFQRREKSMELSELLKIKRNKIKECPLLGAMRAILEDSAAGQIFFCREDSKPIIKPK